jgi:outer membrane protein assembly factor BamE (lipoprotein component of BamABCDE complex)
MAEDAQVQMVGMTKPAVLACMGAPVSRATEGTVEAWAYGAEGASVGAVVPVGTTLLATARRGRCTVNVIFDGPAVSRITYNASGSGFAVPQESCATAVQNCIP